jgi:Lecithin retinol acyltransferase
MRKPSTPAEQIPGTNNEARGVRWQSRCRGELTPADHLLAPAHEPPIGAHIVTPRRGYTHHGIYVGRGRVVQYGGFSWGLCRGPVEEVSLSQFAHGREIRVRFEESHQFDPAEIICRARMRLGENRYHPLKNNCEHFCEWCVRGTPRSYQVDELTALCARAWQGFLRLLRRAQLVRDPIPQRNTSCPLISG